MGLFLPTIFGTEPGCRREFNKTHELLVHWKDDIVEDMPHRLIPSAPRPARSSPQPSEDHGDPASVLHLLPEAGSYQTRVMSQPRDLFWQLEDAPWCYAHSN